MKAFLLLALLAIPSLGRASGSCDLTIEKAPSILGVRLGMKEANVLTFKVIGSASLPVGVRQITIAEPRVEPVQVDYIVVETYDQKVSSIAARYKEKAFWTTENDFEEGLSSRFPGLSTAWQNDGSLSSIECKGFRFAIDRRARQIWLYDTVAEKKIAEAKAKAEAEAAKQGAAELPGKHYLLSKVGISNGLFW